MTRGVRLAIGLALFGSLFAGAIATAQDDGEREARREQLRQSRALLSEAVDAIESGDNESAAVKLRSLLERDPENPDAHYHLARVLIAQGDTAEARTVLEAGAEKAPLSTRIKLMLARLQIADGSPAEAAVLLDGILTLRPHDGETLYLRGLAHLAVGDSLAAVEAWRTSLEATVERGQR